MNDNHWYPRNPQRWLTDTTWCDAATEVAHNRMTDTYYALGKPIKDEASRVQLIGKIRDTDYVRVKGCLMELGWSVENGEWRHKKCEETMQEMETKRQEQINRTKAATELRRKQRNDERNDERNDVLTTTTTTDTNTGTASAAEREASFPEIPPWSLVKAHADRIGLAEWKALDWFNEMEGCGWKDYQGRSVCKWSAVLDRVRTRWEADGRPMKQPGHKVTASGERPKSALDLKTIIQAKNDTAAKIRSKFCSDVAMGSVWSNEAQKTEFFKLKREVKELTQQLGNMA